MLCENWYQWFSPKKKKHHHPTLVRTIVVQGRRVLCEVVVKHRTQIHRIGPFKVLTQHKEPLEFVESCDSFERRMRGGT
jgi:hypothetical protein